MHCQKRKTARSLAPGSLFLTWQEAKIYFLRRLNKPTPSEPSPRSPSRGSGEAVCGSFPLFCADAFWFWSISLIWRTWFPFWSVVVAEVCPAFWLLLAPDAPTPAF